jgi:enoyl-[acyl-carrier protein] reductase I
MFSLAGHKALDRRDRQRPVHRLGMRPALRAQGADLAITFLNARAEPHVRPLAEAVEAEIVMPLDVSVPGQLEAVFAEITDAMGPA